MIGLAETLRRRAAVAIAGGAGGATRKILPPGRRESPLSRRGRRRRREVRAGARGGAPRNKSLLQHLRSAAGGRYLSGPTRSTRHGSRSGPVGGRPIGTESDGIDGKYTQASRARIEARAHLQPAARTPGARRNFPSRANPSSRVWPNRYAHRGLLSCRSAGGLDRARPHRRADHVNVNKSSAVAVSEDVTWKARSSG